VNGFKVDFYWPELGLVVAAVIRWLEAARGSGY
jgi:hypothetical protein